jgi:citrate synthase
LREYSRKICALVGESKYFDITQEVRRVVAERTKVFPNVDLYSASLYHAMGLPQELYTPIFVISRVVGWTSHILEQWSNNRLIRPRAEYVGPHNLHYTDIHERA